MRKKLYLLLLVLLGLLNYAVATPDVCGTPPPDQFREENNESIKGDLNSKANFLSGFVGKAELGGKIEATRKDIFAKYSDANTAYMDRYLAYIFCYVLFDPKNTQTPAEKIKAIQEFKRQQQQPQSSSPIPIQQPSEGPNFASPRLNGRTIDACIKSYLFPELQGLQCTQAAQRVITGEFCKSKGYSIGASWKWEDTRKFQRSYKLFYEKEPNDTVMPRWIQDDTGGAIFTFIQCT